MEDRAEVVSRCIVVAHLFYCLQSRDSLCDVNALLAEKMDE